MEQEPQINSNERDYILSQQNPDQLQAEPRIYVASLSDYNNGYLHGRWIKASLEPEDIEAEIKEMLKSSHMPDAEEYAIHDYDNFGPLRLSEYEGLETISYLAQGIEKYGSSFAHFAEAIEDLDPDVLARFEDAYRGYYDSLEDYARELLDDLGVNALIERAIPDYLQPYVRLDIEGFARDLDQSGDVLISEGDGGVYIFVANY